MPDPLEACCDEPTTVVLSEGGATPHLILCPQPSDPNSHALVTALRGGDDKGNVVDDKGVEVKIDFDEEAGEIIVTLRIKRDTT